MSDLPALLPVRPTPPAEQVSNVLAALLDLVDGPALPGRMDAIRAATHQLADLWQAYQAGGAPGAPQP